jgi:selenocysteine lyase/cysteine desulfurase
MEFNLDKSEISDAFLELEHSVYAALETYSNVHRGSGHFSMVTTHLYEQARKIVLNYLGLNNGYVVIFTTPRSAGHLVAQLQSADFQVVSPPEFGLSLGLRAVAIKRKSLPKGVPFHVGGGNARLISADWIIWARQPDKFEAGTPAILNVIALARALQMIQQSGKDIFKNCKPEKLTASEILYQDHFGKLSGRELLRELRKTLIGKDMQVPTAKGMLPFQNFDNSASTRTFEPVWTAFRQTWRQQEEVKQEIVREVQLVCSKFLGAPTHKYEVIFTSNTTEAINLAAESFRREKLEGGETVVLSSLAEHSSNDLPWRMLPNSSMIRLMPDNDGFIDLSKMETLLADYNEKQLYGDKRIKLVAINGASNVLGVCNNLEEISRIAHQHGVLVMVDAAQLIAHRKVDMEKYGIDFLAFSGHKLYAPFGSGALVARNGLLRFSSDEISQIQSSGEENVAGIAALGKAINLLKRIGMDVISEEEQHLTQMALQGMSTISGLKIHGMKDSHSTEFAAKIGVIPFELKNKISSQTGKELALLGGVGVRTGCHCAHIIVKHILKVGPGLEKFQKLIVSLFPKLSLPGVVRISFGIENTEAEIDAFIRVMGEIAGQAQTSTNTQSGVESPENPKRTKAEIQQQINAFIQSRAVLVYD